MTETFEQMAIRKWQEVCKSLSVGAPVAIKFAAAIRDELAKGAEPVAWMNSRNGFIAKENKNPEYNVGLYTCPPSAAARIAELEEELSAEKESCSLAHADALRQVEHLGRSEALISELESERDALRREVDRLKSEGDKLDAPAVVGNARFGKGVAWRTVIMAAQRRHQETVTPESEAARLEKVAETNLIVSLRDAEIARLNEELAASQAREQQLREDFQTYIAEHEECTDADDWMAMTCSMEAHHVADEALTLPQDTSALAAMVAKAGEVMRKRALVPCDDLSKNDGNSTECRAAAGLCGIAIDAIPAITLDDLKGGAA